MKTFLYLTLFVLLFYTSVLAQIHFTHVTNQPVFSYGASGEWDAGTVWNPSVIKDGDTLRMWYTAYPGSVWEYKPGKIGYAWSLDGIEWHRFTGNPVLTGDLSWESLDLYGCAVIKDGNTFKMWYGAGGTPATKVGYATSLDGINWIKHPNPVLQLDPSPNWGYSIITPHTVIKEESIYKMWYWAGKDGFPFNPSLPQTGLATSSDGINWVKFNDPATIEPQFLSSDPVLKVGASGEWDLMRAIQPMVLRTDLGYEAWYVGTEPTPLPPQSIGYATSTDGITWTKFLFNPIFSTTPIWARDYMGGYYGGTILKFNDEYHFWYSCFHTPPTEARPQIGYATSLVGNIYVQSPIVDEPYARKNIDSILFRTRFSNLYNHQFTAHLICFNSDSTQIDSLKLFDDGLHGDSLTNDGLYGGYIPPRTIEDYYSLSVGTFDHQLNEYLNFPVQGKFTTVPLIFDNVQYSALTNFRYSFKPFLKNASIAHTIKNIVVNITCNDPWITSIPFTWRICTNLLPSQIAGVSQPFAVSYDSATFPGYFNLRFSISSADFSSWIIDTTIIVKPSDVEEEVNEVPTEFLLSQNFPNPFNNSSAIKYSMPNSSKVIIKVFNVLGTEIQTLVNEEKEAGYHSINFDGSEFQSGVYFYQLKAGSFIETKKMILLR